MLWGAIGGGQSGSGKGRADLAPVAGTSRNLIRTRAAPRAPCAKLGIGPAGAREWRMSDATNPEEPALRLKARAARVRNSFTP